MRLDEVQCAFIEQLGAAQFNIRDTAMVMGVNYDELKAAMDDENSLARKHYHRGRLKAELEVRTAIMLSAKNGSSPAQTLAKQLIAEAKMDGTQ